MAVWYDGRLCVRHEPGMLDERLARWGDARGAGTAAIGHVRYSTSGARSEADAQPVRVGGGGGAVALVHNGTITDAHALEPAGRAACAASDTKLLARFLCSWKRGDTTLPDALAGVTGAFSLALLHRDELVLARDPHGFRPLFYARWGNGWVAASETCALEALGGCSIREVAPGQILRLRRHQVTARRFDHATPGFCAMELIYLSRPESRYGDVRVADLRRALGRATARQAPAPADLVVGVPASGLDAAVGYAEESGLPQRQVLHAVSATPRSFILPSSVARRQVVASKFSVAEDSLAGKDVVVVDDSLVRGTTMREVCRLLRSAGTGSIHVRIASPRVRWPCYFGVDFPDPGELIARTAPLELAAAIGADSVAFLAVEGLEGELRRTRRAAHCLGCFSGRYPAPLPASARAARAAPAMAVAGRTC